MRSVHIRIVNGSERLPAAHSPIAARRHAPSVGVRHQRNGSQGGDDSANRQPTAKNCSQSHRDDDRHHQRDDLGEDKNCQRRLPAQGATYEDHEFQVASADATAAHDGEKEDRSAGDRRAHERAAKGRQSGQKCHQQDVDDRWQRDAVGDEPEVQVRYHDERQDYEKWDEAPSGGRRTEPQEGTDCKDRRQAERGYERSGTPEQRDQRTGYRRTRYRVDVAFAGPGIRRSTGLYSTSSSSIRFSPRLKIHLACERTSGAYQY